MVHQSRKRKYTSRRERLQISFRIFRTLLIFGAMFLMIWVLMNRQSLWAYWKTYFY